MRPHAGRQHRRKRVPRIGRMIVVLGHSVVSQGPPMTVGFIRRYVVLFSLSLVAVISEAAVDEQVSIRKVVGNKAVLARGDQDFYLVETRPACPSLALQEGRTVLVRSSDRFLSSKSGLVLANQEQPCKIARAVALFSNAASSAVDDAPG